MKMINIVKNNGYILSGLIFFIFAVFTLPEYGINWDAINHLPRGQAYLHYFLTGEKNFSSLGEFRMYWQEEDTLAFKPDIQVPRISFYQAISPEFSYFVDNDGGHPPLSDILSSFFNFILFQKLGWVNDIDSYRVYSIFLSASLVGLVFFWTGCSYGKFAGLVAALSLALYPLFWSEAHFNNEKDIPETVFWSFLLFCLWQGIRKRSLLWLVLASFFGGLALGTKFNIFFAPFIILPWVLWFAQKNSWFKNPLNFIAENKAFLLFLFFVPLGAFIIFFVSWPYLWADPISRLQDVVGFYKGIGLTKNVDEKFAFIFGINTYSVQWILYTTPLVILALGLVGFFKALKNVPNEKHGMSLFVLLWLIVPIARVTWPGTTTYGGVRQIMEYVPALAMLSGLGAVCLIEWFKNIGWSRSVWQLIVLLAFMPIIVKLVQIHPNENVYFNPLIGGLAGAKERDMPFWGNSFGAVYRQGVVWLNKNASIGAKITYAKELIPNIPRIWLRRDIVVHNSYRSGYLRQGEYIITLTYNDGVDDSYFERYLEVFLEPVYKVEVDGVSILKIWKNDEEHTKEGYLGEKQITDFKFAKTKTGLLFDFGKAFSLLRMEADFQKVGCLPAAYAYVQISEDGLVWKRLAGTMPREDWSVPKLGDQPSDGYVLIPFAADKARYMQLVISPQDACLTQLNKINIFVLL